MKAVETWQTEHEKRCGDRYQLLLAVIGVGGTIMIGVGGWGLNKVFDGQQQQMDYLRQATLQQPSSSTVVVNPTAR